MEDNEFDIFSISEMIYLATSYCGITTVSRKDSRVVGFTHRTVHIGMINVRQSRRNGLSMVHL
jgi:hypothetical protein